MHYAIIAAGEGSRLKSEGIATPKPLVEIGGVPLIERLVRIFVQNKAASISIIVNQELEVVRRLQASLSSTLPFHVVVLSTPGSMHSFKALAPFLTKGKFCLTTVDTIFDEREFAHYIAAFEASESLQGMMGVTDYIDDESPLYVATDDQLQITGFRNSSYEGAKYISGGIYGLTSDALTVLEQCMASGKLRMREFQQALVDSGFRLRAFPFSKVIDIDHATDIAKAEALLATPHPISTQKNRSIALIARAEEYSPQSEQKDALILQAIAEQLNQMGYLTHRYSEALFSKAYQEEPYVLHMARRAATLAQLEELARRGVVVFNAPDSIRNGDRLRFTELLHRYGIPQPRTVVVDTVDPLQTPPFEAMWVKKGEGYTMEEHDICFVPHREGLSEVLARFASQGIHTVVVSEHVAGDLLKVYGVDRLIVAQNYPTTTREGSKFGHEWVNGAPHYHPFSAEKLQQVIDQCATAFGLEFWGIDLVVTPAGELKVIDVNDFPSYSSCRTSAAEAIAQRIDRSIQTDLA